MYTPQNPPSILFRHSCGAERARLFLFLYSSDRGDGDRVTPPLGRRAPRRQRAHHIHRHAVGLELPVAARARRRALGELAAVARAAPRDANALADERARVEHLA